MGDSGWLGPRSIDGGIDEVPLPSTLPGRLWLCGKHLVGPSPIAALHRVGADLIVCLNERHELLDRYPDYVRWLDDPLHDQARWHPVPDLGVRPHDEMVVLIDEIVAELRCGTNLIVHCGAGIGRAGTVAAAVLVRAGHTASDALAVVTAARPMAGPEAGAQRTFIDDLARPGRSHG